MSPFPLRPLFVFVTVGRIILDRAALDGHEPSIIPLLMTFFTSPFCHSLFRKFQSEEFRCDVASPTRIVTPFFET